MENNTDIQTGTQTGAEGTQEKTFTQDEVNRIVQDRLAREKGKGSEERGTCSTHPEQNKRSGVYGAALAAEQGICGKAFQTIRRL